jgi:hypothetical protein
MPVGHSALKDKLRDTPRPIRLRRGAKTEGHGIWFFVLLPHTYAGIVVGAIVLFQLYVAMAAPIVDGRVTDRRISRGSKSTHYELTYTFTSNGQPRTEHESVAEQRYDDYPVGKPVKVRACYVGDWGSAHLVGNAEPSKYLFMLLWVVVWNGAMAAIFYGQYILPRRRRWLLEHGDVSPRGVITAVTPPASGKSTGWQVKYDYATPDGQTLQGTARLPTAQATPPAEFLSQGQELTVFYSPNKPRQNVALELSPYEIPGAEALTTFAAVNPAPIAPPAAAWPPIPNRPPRKAVMLPPPPRQIRRTVGTPRGVWIIRVVLLVFAVIGYYLARAALKELAMGTVGRQTTATVIRTDAFTMPDRSTRVRATYTYEDHGSHYEDVTTVPTGATMRVGSTFPVKSVHLGRIGWSVPASQAGGGAYCCLLPFAIIWNLVVIFMLRLLFLGPWRGRRLLKHGECAEGIVTAKEPVDAANPSGSWRITCEFTSSWGERRTKQITWPASYQAELQVGDHVPVLYWPNNPSRAAIFRGGGGGYNILNDRGEPVGT